MLAELALADTQFARGNYPKRSTPTRASPACTRRTRRSRTATSPSRSASATTRTCRTTSGSFRRPTRRISRRCVDALRELNDFLEKYPDSNYVEAGPGAAQGGAAAAGRPRGLRRALLSEGRSPQGGGHAPRGGLAPLPGVGPRAGAAGLAGRDLPADGRPATRQRRPSPASSPSSPTRRRPGAPSSISSSSRAATGRTHSRRRRRRPRHPMDDTDRSGLRELVARGREHYQAGEYDKAETCLTEVLREQAAYADVYDMLGVIYHQEGRLAEAEAMFQQALQHQPRLHRGGPEPGRHLQRPREVPRGEGRSTSGRWPRRSSAPREPGSVRARERSRTCTPRWAPPTSRRRCTTTPSASTSGRWRCARPSSTSAPAGRHAARGRRSRRRPIRELRARCGGEPRASSPARLQLGLSYYAAGRRDDAVAEWRAVLAIDARQQVAARMYLALRDMPRSRSRASLLAFVSVTGSIRRRGDPGLRALRRGRAHLPLDREAGAHDARRDQRGWRGLLASTRATSATPG